MNVLVRFGRVLNEPETNVANHAWDGQRRSYEAPKITFWGSLAELTAGPHQDGLADLPLGTPGHQGPTS